MKINTIRFAHYNILKGGENRLDQVSKAISLLNADICGILEAVGWQNDLSFWEEFGEKIGFPYFHIATANTKYNIAVFSKYPVVVTALNTNFKHVALKVKILEEAFSDIDLNFVHLSPTSEDERLIEVNKLLEDIKESKKVIIMGDFNSLSRKDPYDEWALLDFFDRNNIKKYGQNKLRYEVITKLEASNFTDVQKLFRKKFNYSVPTSSNIDPHHSQKLRIDYAFVSNFILSNCIDCKIVKGDLYEKASDHYPVILDYKI